MRYLYQDLENELVSGINSGLIPVGMKLPSIRQQCDTRKISKATVIHAYQRLEAAGLVEVRAKSGYFVILRKTQHPVPSPHKIVSVPRLVDMSDVMRDIMAQSAAFDISPQADKRSDMPVGINELNRSLSRALRRQSGSEHQYYDEPAGLLALRKQICSRYQRFGCNFHESEVIVTAGCQHALSLALQLCCKPGDIVAVESPGFYGVLQLLESMGLQVLEIPVTAEQGISVDALTEVLEKWGISACVVTPSFATPVGSVIPEGARNKLLELAERYQFKIVEDDIYGDLSFSHRIPPLKQLDKNNSVILCGSYSKSLSRELRLGWVISSSEQKTLMRLKMVNMLALSRYVQQGLSDFLEDGGYDKHIRKQKVQLQQQRDQLIDLLFSHWRELGDIRVSQPEGGLTLWVELEEAYDVSASYLEAREQGIIITPGNLFTAQTQYRNCLRLSFAHPWNERRQMALIQLGEILLKQKASA